MEFKMKGSTFYGKKITYGKEGVNSPLMMKKGASASDTKLMKEAARPTQPSKFDEPSKPRRRAKMVKDREEGFRKPEGLRKEEAEKSMTKKMDRPGMKDPDLEKPSYMGRKPSKLAPRETMTEKPSKKMYTKEEHEANKANNAKIDQEMLDYKKAYSDKHGSSSGGSDEEWAEYQEGLKNMRKKYRDR